MNSLRGSRSFPRAAGKRVGQRGSLLGTLHLAPVAAPGLVFTPTLRLCSRAFLG